MEEVFGNLFTEKYYRTCVIMRSIKVCVLTLEELFFGHQPRLLKRKTCILHDVRRVDNMRLLSNEHLIAAVYKKL